MKHKDAYLAYVRRVGVDSALVYSAWVALVFNAQELKTSIRNTFARITNRTAWMSARAEGLASNAETNAPDLYTVEALAYQPEQEAGLTPYELDNMRNYWPRLALDAMRERVIRCVQQDDYIRVRNERTGRTVKVKTVLALDLAMYFHKFA
jgi:hypothetical protein